MDIRPGSAPLLETFHDLLEHRELIYLLAWRDVKVRYKQTFLGVAWALIRPIIAVAIFSFIFGNIAALPSGGIPYPLLAMSGVIAWNLMSEGITAGSQNMLVNTNLVTRVYFPRLIMPMASMLRGLVDLGVSVLLFTALAVFYRQTPSWTVLLFPLAVAYAFFSAFGISLWLSALAIRYRDVAHALPFIMQAFFWISPVGYSVAVIPRAVETAYWCNPFVGAIALFRSTLLAVALPETELLLLSVASSFAVFSTGYLLFQRTEAAFADMI